MKGIDALIKIRVYELDQKRRALRQIEEVQARIERDIAALKDEIATEQNAARHSDEGSYTYGGYARRAISRRAELHRTLGEVGKQVDAARDDVARTFEGLKKFEITKAARDDAEHAEVNRRERMALDELGLNAYTRNKTK
ncbi:MAG: flagellar FliJ family protein [Alphaproteobacteria bacterium]